MKRGLTPEEVAHYETTQKRHPELNLPDLNDGVEIEFTRQGPVTFCTLELAEDGIAERLGWAVYSPIDRKMKKPDRPAVGESVAFNRAIKSPVAWGQV